jgi:Spy/CpxP family protein refolding chaperone
MCQRNTQHGKEIKMNKRITTTAVLAALLLAGGTAFAQAPGMGGGPMMGREGMEGSDQGGDMLQRMLPILHSLDLSDDQREDIRTIMDTTRERIEALRETGEGSTIREQFRDLFTSSSITAAQVEDLLNERLSRMEEVNAIIAAAIVEVHDVLTADQLAAIAEFDPDQMDMHGGDHPMMRGGSHRGINPQR